MIEPGFGVSMGTFDFAGEPDKMQVDMAPGAVTSVHGGTVLLEKA